VGLERKFRGPGVGSQPFTINPNLKSFGNIKMEGLQVVYELF